MKPYEVVIAVEADSPLEALYAAADLLVDEQNFAEAFWTQGQGIVVREVPA